MIESSARAWMHGQVPRTLDGKARRAPCVEGWAVEERLPPTRFLLRSCGAAHWSCMTLDSGWMAPRVCRSAGGHRRHRVAAAVGGVLRGYAEGRHASARPHGGLCAARTPLILPHQPLGSRAQSLQQRSGACARGRAGSLPPPAEWPKLPLWLLSGQTLMRVCCLLVPSAAPSCRPRWALHIDLRRNLPFASSGSRGRATAHGAV